MAIPLLTLDVLDSITIPTHCPVPWEEMEGDDRTRHCAKCQERVHDVAALTPAEAVELLSSPGKSPCLRIYRRTDGRVMTADCPANRRERIWRWLGRRSVWASSLFAILFLSGCRTATQGLIIPDGSPRLLPEAPPIPDGRSPATPPRTTP
jgi:hypothetical protein